MAHSDDHKSNANTDKPATLGFSEEPNPKRELIVEHRGKSYARYPVHTNFLNLGEKIEDFIDKYAKPSLKENDILCISAKVVSISRKFVVHESEVEPTWLSRLIVKFVKKWPNDPGYANPRKMQVAIEQAGYPRIILALIVGSFLRLFGKRGYFYRIAGNRINAIDGFTSGPISGQYALLPPPHTDDICDEWEERYNVGVTIIDGNNIDNNIMGMSRSVKEKFSEADLMQILRGNPQGQEDDGPTTPILVVREV